VRKLIRTIVITSIITGFIAITADAQEIT